MPRVAHRCDTLKLSGLWLVVCLKPMLKDAVSKTTMKVIYVGDYGQATMN